MCGIAPLLAGNVCRYVGGRATSSRTGSDAGIGVVCLGVVGTRDFVAPSYAALVSAGAWYKERLLADGQREWNMQGLTFGSAYGLGRKRGG